MFASPTMTTNRSLSLFFSLTLYLYLQHLRFPKVIAFFMLHSLLFATAIAILPMSMLSLHVPNFFERINFKCMYIRILWQKFNVIVVNVNVNRKAKVHYTAISVNLSWMFHILFCVHCHDDIRWLFGCC